MPTQTTNETHADIGPILRTGDEQPVRELAVKRRVSLGFTNDCSSH